jgi:hypothetical protein
MLSAYSANITQQKLANKYFNVYHQMTRAADFSVVCRKVLDHDQGVGCRFGCSLGLLTGCWPDNFYQHPQANKLWN